jgi:hypothetical protein
MIMMREDVAVDCSNASGKDRSSSHDVFNGIEYSWC